MMNPASRLATAFVALMILAAPALAGDTKKAEGFMADARKSMEKGDAKTAIIQLKNAVQADPDSGLARYELGRVELIVGDVLSAEKEFRAAQERNFDRDKIAPALAEVLLRQQKYNDLLEQVPAGDRAPDVEAGVRVARGYALMNLKRFEDAKRSFQDASSRGSKPALGQLGLARVYAAEGKYDDALAWAQTALDSDPNLVDAWLLTGRAKRLKGDTAGSRAAYDKAIAIKPDSEQGRIERASLLIATGDLKTATADLNDVIKINPRNPYAGYYVALIKARQKDYRNAELTLINLKGFLDQYPPALYLLASVQGAQGNLAQAEDTINKFLTRLPNDEAGIGLLANFLVKRNATPKAIEVLSKALEAHPQSLRLLGLLSEAYARNKQPEKAAEMLDRAATLNPDDAQLRTRIGAQRLRLGQTAEAIADLETAAELAPKSEEAGLLLILTLMQTNKIDDAKAAAEQLRNRLPDDPVPENLLGAIALRQNDALTARKHFEKALTIKPDFTPAQLNLAQLAMAERHFDQAQAALDQILKRDPANLDAMMMSGALAEQQGRGNDAILAWEKARNSNEKASGPRLKLIDAYIRSKQPQKAVEVAVELEKVAPGDLNAQIALGEARLANNESDAAINVFQRIVQNNPGQARALLLLARAQYIGKDTEGARASLEKAVELAPRDNAAGEQYVRFAVETKTAPQAIQFLKRLASQRGEELSYDVLAGDLQLASNQLQDAVASYQAALAKNPNATIVAVKLAETQARLDPAAGISTMADWVGKHPDQIGARLVYGSMLISAKRFDDAQKEHEAILRVQPENPVASNNLAWLYQRKKDPRALPLAEKAYAAAPASLELADTLGWILTQKGETQRAIDLLKRATSVPEAPAEVRYHYAVALKNAGQKDEAKQQLQAAIKSNQNFDGLEDAKKLLGELGG